MNLSLDISPITRRGSQDFCSLFTSDDVDTLLSILFAPDDIMGHEHANDSVTPGEFDIILERDKLAINHTGNRRYRRLIEMNFERYQQCGAARNGTKRRIANEVIQSIQESGGRFLKKNEQDGTYEEVDPKYAHDKVSHALRSHKKKCPRVGREPRRVDRKASTPEEDRIFESLYHNQQIIFRELVKKGKLMRNEASHRKQSADVLT